MSPFDPERRYVRKTELVFTEMDGDLVMMDVESGEYYGVSGIGTRIWALLAQPVSQEDIVRAICAEFEVDAATARADAREFLVQLLDRHLLAQA